MIKITKIGKSNLANFDLNNLAFGKVFTDHMFEANFENGSWGDFEINPLKPLSVHPGNLAWHYGQSIFEGMKASITQDGVPMLFRPEKHIERLNASARRMCMPEFPKDVFMNAIHTIVDMEKSWIPSSLGSALYIRPLMFATDEAIGVRPSSNYKFLIMTLPVGPYYATPVKLKVADTYIRAAQGGVGEAKTAGNYAASLYPAKLAKEEGFDQVMWLDANEFKYVQEVGTMNIFFKIDGKIITPSTDGTILKGITRESAIEILKTNGMSVEQRPIAIDEITEAHKNGTLQEVFGTGTAAVVAKVSHIGFKGELLELNANYEVASLIKDTIDGLRAGKIEDTWNWTVPVKSNEQISIEQI